MLKNPSISFEGFFLFLRHIHEYNKYGTIQYPMGRYFCPVKK